MNFKFEQTPTQTPKKNGAPQATMNLIDALHRYLKSPFDSGDKEMQQVITCYDEIVRKYNLVRTHGLE